MAGHTYTISSHQKPPGVAGRHGRAAYRSVGTAWPLNVDVQMRLVGCTRIADFTEALTHAYRIAHSNQYASAPQVRHDHVHIVACKDYVIASEIGRDIMLWRLHALESVDGGDDAAGARRADGLSEDAIGRVVRRLQFPGAQSSCIDCDEIDSVSVTAETSTSRIEGVSRRQVSVDPDVVAAVYDEVRPFWKWERQVFDQRGWRLAAGPCKRRCVTGAEREGCAQRDQEPHARSARLEGHRHPATDAHRGTHKPQRDADPKHPPWR